LDVTQADVESAGSISSVFICNGVMITCTLQQLGEERKAISVLPRAAAPSLG